MRHFLRTCALCGICAALLSADRITSLGQEAESSSGSKESKIFVPDCRVQLPRIARLASDRPGIIAFIEPEEGDKVTAGQFVAGLRDEVAKTNVAITKAVAEVDIEVRYAKAAHDVDSKDLERAENANKGLRNAVPEMEVSKMRLAKERSRLQIEKAEQDQVVNKLKWDQADAEWKTYQVDAPFNGVVTNVMKQKGEAVRQGDPILEVVDTERVRVEGNVEFKDVFAIKPGARVVVQLSIPKFDLDVEKQTFEGRITFVDVTAISEKVRIWAEVKNHDNILRGGLFASMTIYPEDVVEPQPKISSRNSQSTDKSASTSSANP